jgi:hypothetical protein
MAASDTELGELHATIASQLAAIIRDGATVTDKEGNQVQVSAGPAYFGAAIAFLKNNNITADVSENAELAELALTLKKKRDSRKLTSAQLAEAQRAFEGLSGEGLPQ